jgi:hypothetical protein
MNTHQLNVMPPQFNKFLNQRQYDTICKYFKIIERLNKEKKILDQTSRYQTYDYWSDDDYILKCIDYNNRLNNQYKEIQDKLIYYEQEYNKYINKIGFKLNDTTQDEHLFNLLNNNILLDFVTV